MKVVNLFAGPGAGKSTTAAGLFHRLKTDGVNCELVGEYAKDLTWAGRITELKNQIKVLGEQYHRLDRLRGKVDVAIVDSPLPLCVVYARRAMPEPEMSMLRQSVGATALHAFETFDNLNVFLVREKPYIKVGRHQTEDEAKGLDAEIRELLEMFSIPHAVVRGSTDAPQEIQKLLFSPAGLMRQGKCGTCRGTGRVGPADDLYECAYCGGTGHG